MSKQLKVVLLVGALAGTALLCAWWLLRPQAKPQITLQQVAEKIFTENYRHELLALYDPPEEIFSAAGYQQLKTLQRNYTKVFLPYLIMGSTLLHPNVLYNPWFDLALTLDTSSGLIDGVGVLNCIDGEEIPQMELTVAFWQEMYIRYSHMKERNLRNLKPKREVHAPVLELQNLTNKYGWPSKLYFLKDHNRWELYIQRPEQAIYCTPSEPGCYVVINLTNNVLHTNVFALPTYLAIRSQTALGRLNGGQEKFRANNL